MFPTAACGQQDWGSSGVSDAPRAEGRAQLSVRQPMAQVACNHHGDKQLRLDSNTRCLTLSKQAAAGRRYTLGLVDVSCDTRGTVLVLSSPVIGSGGTVQRLVCLTYQLRLDTDLMINDG